MLQIQYEHLGMYLWINDSFFKIIFGQVCNVSCWKAGCNGKGGELSFQPKQWENSLSFTGRGVSPFTEFGVLSLSLCMPNIFFWKHLASIADSNSAKGLPAAGFGLEQLEVVTGCNSKRRCQPNAPILPQGLPETSDSGKFPSLSKFLQTSHNCSQN